MPTILNDTLKAELEQTRARLLSEQETIAETVTKEAEAEIDRVLGYINSLLGEADAEPAESAPESQPAAKTPAKTTAKKSAAPKSSSKNGFDAAKLKSKFKDLKAMDAILKVLADEKSALSIDDLINQLYDEFDPAEISKARRSVAITTKHAERRGLLKKVQDNPSRFEIA